ncbi:HNH endonuclease [Pseudarthrobacter sp. HLT3-5]|uniref:HNH endonuclease n=1 Tax=Pseudarthrobacter cellobiosi TaxID=2953654 RepID=UPI00208E7F3B|nr:HNH endonuclease [Pseudarthrobacter sp. HLT3-5]MCO4274248.1 HNH endonuclease [Pseudarthrobacter sp. HLT3-5]
MQASDGTASQLYHYSFFCILMHRKQASNQMKRIKLSGIRGDGKYAIVDDDVAQQTDVASYKWHVGTNGYVQRYKYVGQKNGRSNYTPLLLHRHIMSATPGTEIDHANGDPLDNRRSNLRFCSRQQNIRNRTVANKTGYKGIYWRKQSQEYVARLTIDGRSLHTGMSNDPEAAALMYDVAAIQLFDEFAQLNIIGRQQP